MTATLSIIVPTYNERRNVEALVVALESELFGVNWEVIFVDDDSPDGTSDRIREIAREKANVRCIQRLGRRGLSSACIEGILSSSAPYLLIMDADMQHDESIIPSMMDTLKREDIDIVIGSRYTKEGSSGELQPFRVEISQFATKVSQIILKVPVSDPMSGFFMLKCSFFKGIMHHLSGNGFKILLDILVSAGEDIGYIETPYSMRARTHGESKLGPQVVWEFVTLILNKLLRQLIQTQFISFVMVGFSGVFMHIAVLAFFHKFVELAFLYAQTLAVLTAMTSNYFLNNYFTFCERRLIEKSMVKGLISFYIACGIGAVVNVSIAEVVFNYGIPWRLAGLIGAVVGTVWNYVTIVTFTWKKKAVV